MTQKTYAAALIEALYERMARGPEVSVIGSYVLGLGPLRHLVNKIRDDFGDRVIDPPSSEAAVASLGIGAAMAGARPFIDLGTASFAFEACSQIVNEAANAHYMSGGQISVPVVFHMLHGLRGGGAAQHSHSPQAMFWNCPGLEIVLPSTPYDVKGLLHTAIMSNNPTIVLDHASLMAIEQDVPDEDYTIPFGRADIKRQGKDVTVVATSLMVQVVLQAAQQLIAEGIDIEVVDPRTLVPLDQEAILASVRKTGRLVVVDETFLSCGVASEIAAVVAEKGFASLKAPILRVVRPDVPVAFSPVLEHCITPTVDKVVDAVRRLMLQMK